MPERVRVDVREAVALAESVQPCDDAVRVHGLPIVLRKYKALVLVVFAQAKPFLIALLCTVRNPRQKIWLGLYAAAGICGVHGCDAVRRRERGAVMLNVSNTPKPDASHSRKWTLRMLYAVEQPELEAIAKRTVAQKRRRVEQRHFAYAAAKKAAWKLVGWDTHEPRLRSGEAWDCYFRYILEELRI